MSSFLTIQQLTRDDASSLLQQSQHYADAIDQKNFFNAKRGIFYAPLFFENSTRTRVSFEIAAKRQGFSVIDTGLAVSSLSKGETPEDTLRNLEAFGCRVFVIRHTETAFIERLAACAGKNSSVINAGSGCDHHPTQALLDFLTIQQHFKDLSTLRIAIVGDLAHSRVASSFLALAQLLGVKDVRLVAPPMFQPPKTHCFGYPMFEDLKQGLENVDVVMTLRVQQERIPHQNKDAKAFEEYKSQYQINARSVKWASPHAIVMHPGPMNREIEISSDVADGKQSVILQQAKLGVAVRMAVLDWCTNS